MLASERSNVVREQVLAFCRDQGLGAWDRRTQQGFLRNLVVREGRRTGQLQVRLVTIAGQARRRRAVDAVDADGLFWTQTDGLGETHPARRDRAAVRRRRSCDEQLGDLRFLISPRRVLPDQHRDGGEALRRSPPRYAALRGCERVFDLYCGIGTIGLSLAARAREVIGVEIVEAAVADAIENARLNEIANARSSPATSALAMRELVERAGTPDVVVVDPPRAGLSQKVVRRIIEAAPQADRLRLLQPDDARAERRASSSRPATTLRRVRPVDMFPQTPHIECVALLERA